MVFAHDVKKSPWCGTVFDESDPNRSMNNFLHLRWCTKRPLNLRPAQVKRCRTPKITKYFKK